jgi:hypothetical protein
MKRRISFSVRMGDLQMFSGSVEVLKSDAAGKTRHGPCVSHLLIGHSRIHQNYQKVECYISTTTQ